MRLVYVVGVPGAGKSSIVRHATHALYPANVPCNCGAPLCPQITPDEARERVNQAVQQGLVSRPALQQWANQVTQYRQQHG